MHIEVSGSPAVVEFHEALARAFGAVEHAQQTGRDGNKKKAGQDRPYSTLSDVDRACRKALTDEGFSFPQYPVTRWTEDGMMFISVHTLLCRGGVTLSEPSPFELPVLGQRQSNASGGGHGPPDAQAVGSALTYARRYSLGALMGICPEDDDGHAASSPPPEDKLWAAFQAVVNRLAAAQKVSFEQAYGKVREHANISPKGDPTDEQLVTLTATAQRLLSPPPQDPHHETAMDRLNTAVGKVGKMMAMEWAAASKLVESKAGIKLDGVRPTPAQVVTLLGAAERLLADRPAQDPQHTPERDAWVAVGRELLAMIKADHETAEGVVPNEGEIKEMRDTVKRVSGIDHKNASESDFKASTARIKVEIERRKAP